MPNASPALQEEQGHHRHGSARFLLGSLGVGLVLLLAAQGWAEPASPSLTGVVSDPSGANVPGATVRVDDEAGATIASSTTDGRGAFAVSGLTPGSYNVAVALQGFKLATARVALDGRHPRSLSIRLQLAAVEEQVTVNRGALSTDSAENAGAVRVDASSLAALPVFDQDLLAAVAPFLDPGMTGEGGPALIVDGAESSRIPVSASAVQEIKIDENPYSAEFFRPGRGRIEVVTKSDSADYHGSFGLLFRDASLNAREPFATSKAPEQRRIYEGHLTGPLPGSRGTSFQVSFERREEDLQAIVVAAGPDGAIRGQVPSRQRGTELSLRLTRQWSSGHTSWVRYSLEGRSAANQSVGGFTLPEAGTNSDGHEDSLNVSDQVTLGPRALNQLQLHFEWDRRTTTSINDVPRIVVQDAFTGGGAQADQRNRASEARLLDVLSWTMGRHHLKVGFQVSDWTHRSYDDRGNRGGTFFFSSIEDYLADRAYSFTVQSGDGRADVFHSMIGGFVQDEMKLGPGLSLAIGARYDYQNLIHAGVLEPRAFAAFAPGGKRSLVFRAGVGLFADRFPAPAAGDIQRYDGHHLASYVLLDPPSTGPSQPLPGLAAQPTTLVRLDPTNRPSQIIQYSGGVEWQPVRATTLSLTYRGSRGIGLLRSRDVNAPTAPDSAERPDPTLGRVRQIESAGHQQGDALELGLRAKVGKLFTTVAQYTLSRTHSNTAGVGFFPANSYDPLADWGPADFDQRHRLNLLGTLDVRQVKLGVALAMASGRPYTLTTGNDDNHDGFATDRPAGVGRNGLRAPGSTNLDIQLSRSLYLDHARREKGPALTVSLAAFNALNTFNATRIVGSETSPLFGQVVDALPARRIQLSARLDF